MGSWVAWELTEAHSYPLAAAWELAGNQSVGDEQLYYHLSCKYIYIMQADNNGQEKAEVLNFFLPLAN